MQDPNNHNTPPLLTEPKQTHRRPFASAFKYFRKKIKTKSPSYKANEGTVPSSGNDRRPGPSNQDASPPAKPTTPQIVERNNTSTFQDAREVNISGNPQFLNVGKWHQNVTNVHTYSSAHNLALLKEFVSFSALHDSSEQDPDRQCHPGTRESVLTQMRNWIDNPNMPERILWLHGPAGVGKSAIAQTISSSYGRDTLAATFFFFRSDPSRSDANRLFPTLAWQLTKSLAPVRGDVTHALTEDSDLPRKALEHQFEHLIFRPLQNIIASSPQLRELSPVVIIDGVDECVGEKLQQRIIKTIGKAVTDSHFPLRFLISSRPEGNIEEEFNRLPFPILRIDLAETDGWRRDVEKYLIEEFSRIALEQRLDPEIWPSHEVIQSFVDKSSGQFVYPSTIIRFVGDEYCSASSQLAIIMGLRPTDGASPFSYLDALYMDILQRQPHQKFMKDFFAVLVARGLAQDTGDDPGRDDAVLLNVDENELRRKLRGMRSVLRFQDHIHLHHRSFFDFLSDPGRSTQYHISEQGSTRRYLELITNTLVRYASRTLKGGGCDGVKHFSPVFGNVIARYPPRINLPLREWDKVLQPLLRVKDDWLKSSNLSSPWRRESCDQCATFYIIDNLLLHLSFVRGTSYSTTSPSEYLISPEEQLYTPSGVSESVQEADICEYKYPREWVENTSSAPTPAEPKDCSEDDLDVNFLSLLTSLRSMKSKSSVNSAAISLIQTLLHFDPSEIALKVHSVSDAELIFDFIFKVRKYWNQGTAQKIARLALEIYARVPLVPPALFINEEREDDIENHSIYRGKEVRTWLSTWSRINSNCQFMFVWAILSHDNVYPFLGVLQRGSGLLFVYQNTERSTSQERLYTSSSIAKEGILGVARVIQYMNSLGISIWSLPSGTASNNSNLSYKVMGLGLSAQYCASAPYTSAHGPWWEYPSDVLKFGCFLHQCYLNSDISVSGFIYGGADFDAIKRPSEPIVPDHVWQLIERCLSEDAKDRPTIADVVREIETWE